MHKVADKIDQCLVSVYCYPFHTVVSSIAKIINLSFSTGKFPVHWKIAKVTPLCKKGADSDLTMIAQFLYYQKYQKWLYCTSHAQLSHACLMENNLIYSRQSGFIVQRLLWSNWLISFCLIWTMLCVQHGSWWLSQGIRYGGTQAIVVAAVGSKWYN